MDDVKLLNYPADKYVHTSIALNILCELLPTSKACKIALVHGVSAGSRCKPAQLLASTVNHSCLACSKYSTIFVSDKNKAQLSFDHVNKSRKNQSVNEKSNTQTGNYKNIEGNKLNLVTPEFPPNISDRNDLSHTIISISSACRKMNKSNIEEAGCSVCGELKSSKSLSHVKNIKNMLHILSATGVTRIERKKKKTQYVNILDQFLIILAIMYVITAVVVFVMEKFHNWLWLTIFGWERYLKN